MTGLDPLPILPDWRRRSLAGGAALMVIYRLLDRLIGVVSVMLLARLLSPSDFGLVAMATSVVALIELMSAFGFDTALIQRPNAQRRHFDTVWTFQALFGVATALLLLCVASAAADFYNDPRIGNVLPALGLVSLLNGLSNVGPVLFRKNLDFAREFGFLLSKRLAGFFSTLVAALVLRSYWGLVVGMLIGSSVSLLISYLLHPYRPRFSLAARDELFHFSKWLFISNLLLFFQSNADRFILGRTVGSRELGIYSLASEVAALPATAVIAPINRAVFPAYAALNGDLPSLERRFLNVVGHIAMIAFPLSFGLAVLAEPVIAMLLGSQWMESVPLLRLFLVVGLIGALQSNLYSLIVALGYPQKSTMISLLLASVSLPSLVVASIYFGAVGAAWAHIFVGLIGLIPLHIIFFRLTGFSIRNYAARFPRPLLAALAASVFVDTVLGHLALNESLSPMLSLILGSALGSIVYASTLLVLWWAQGRPEDSVEKAMLARVAFRWRARRRS